MALILFLIITKFLISSCSEDELPIKYELIFKNNYFESINVKIDTIEVPKLLPNQESKAILIQKGIYEIQCTTKSNLLIKSNLDLKGKNEQVDIILDKKGKIILRN